MTKIDNASQKITPFLWFNDNAEEAISFYVRIFPDSKLTEARRYGDGAPFPQGTLMSANFQLAGQQFIALNGGPLYTFSPAISLFVHCDTQDEVDRYWDQLTQGGEPSRCGWLKDKFGLSWQIIPGELSRLLSDPATAGPALQAMLGMSKIDIAGLKRAANGASV